MFHLDLQRLKQYSFGDAQWINTKFVLIIFLHFEMYS